MVAGSQLDERGVLHNTPYALYGLIALTFALLLVAHVDTLQELVQRWNNQEEFSHGYFIPLISLWLLWNRRAALAQSFGRPSWLGVGVVLAGSALFLLGMATDTLLFQDVALVGALFGLALAAGGWPLLRVTFVPLFFLFFMIPLPYAISSILTFQLQLLSSALGTGLIRLCEIPVYLEGNVIDLGTYKLGIVEACSGLRYMIPFLSLGFLGAYLYRGPLWHKALIFLSVIPISIFMNSFRIAAIGVAADSYGVSSADSLLHAFEGWIVFVACIALLYAVMVVLAQFRPAAQADSLLALEVPRPAPGGSGAQGMGMPATLVSAAVLLAATAVAVQFGVQRTIVPPDRVRLAELAYDLEDWDPRLQTLEPEIEEVLGADDYIVADLATGAELPVNLYIAYLDAQRDNRSWHSPQQCIPGGGWVIEELRRTDIAQPNAAAPITVNRVRIARGRARQLIYYWYQQRGRTMASEWSVKYYLAVDAMLRSRTDGALIRLTTPLDPDADVGEADARLLATMERLQPILPKYIPE